MRIRQNYVSRFCNVLPTGRFFYLLCQYNDYMAKFVISIVFVHEGEMEISIQVLPCDHTLPEYLEYPFQYDQYYEITKNKYYLLTF